MVNFTNLRYDIIALRYLIREETKYSSEINFLTRVRLLLKGFTSEKFSLYNFEKNNIDDYLTDFQRRKTQKINGNYSVIIDDKNIFEKILKDENVVPKTYGKINNKKIILDDKETDIHSLIDLVGKKNSLIIKKKVGGGGKGIYRVESSTDGININNKLFSNLEFKEFLNNLDDSLITEHLQQADYSNEIYPGTINTIRMLVMKNPNSGTSFIATAVHKFGSKKTEPADNVWRGGLTSLVDLEIGVLGRPALHHENNKEIEWLEKHPDTKVKIEGIKIPNWDQIKTSVLELTDKLEHIDYVGWDVVITNNGYKIIEGNNFSDVNILQIHKPLLKDKQVKSFYKYHDII